MAAAYTNVPFPNVVFIMTGTLDDASWVKPTMEIFLDSAQSWVSLGGERQRFPGTTFRYGVSVTTGRERSPHR
jgi:hypothetical protein